MVLQPWARGFCSPVCLPHGQEYEKAQKVKKSQKKRHARSMKSAMKSERRMHSKMASLESLITAGFEQSGSRATDVLNSIVTSTGVVCDAIVTGTGAVTDAVLEAADKAAKDTQQVLETTKEGIRQAELGRLKVEDQRLEDQRAANDKDDEEEEAMKARLDEEIKEKKALRAAKQQKAEAKAAAKKVQLDETWAREAAEKTEREAAAKAASSALLASVGKEVGAAVAGKVGEVIEAIKEVKNVVDNTNEAAALAAEAAVIGADASKDTKEAVEALASTFEEKVRVLLLREKTIQSMIEGPEDVNEPQSTKDYQTVIKQELAVIQKSITDLGQQRATANQRNSAPAPAPTTRSGATRNGAATTTRNSAATTTRKQPAPRERLPVLKKGELGKQIRLAVAAFASDKQDGAYLQKITALSKVRPHPLPPALPPAAPCRTRTPLARLPCSAHDPARCIRWRRCRSCSCWRSRRTSCCRPSPPSSRASPPTWWTRRPPTRASLSPPRSPPSTPSTPRSRPTRKRWSWWRSGWCHRSSR